MRAPLSAFWYGEPNAISNAIGYAQFYSRSHDGVIRVYDEAGNVIVPHACARMCRNPILPPPASPVPATATQQNDDDYNYQ